LVGLQEILSGVAIFHLPVVVRLLFDARWSGVAREAGVSGAATVPAELAPLTGSHAAGNVWPISKNAKSAIVNKGFVMFR
jgi:hypothetical protein